MSELFNIQRVQKERTEIIRQASDCDARKGRISCTPQLWEELNDLTQKIERNKKIIKNIKRIKTERVRKQNTTLIQNTTNVNGMSKNKESPDNGMNTTTNKVRGRTAVFFTAGIPDNVKIPQDTTIRFWKIYTNAGAGKTDGITTGYDYLTGAFVAPVAGVYLFKVHLSMTITKPQAQVKMNLRKNGRRVVSLFQENGQGSIKRGRSVSTAVTVVLDKLDRIDLHTSLTSSPETVIHGPYHDLSMNYGHGDGPLSTFTGAILYEFDI